MALFTFLPVAAPTTGVATKSQIRRNDDGDIVFLNNSGAQPSGSNFSILDRVGATFANGLNNILDAHADLHAKKIMAKGAEFTPTSESVPGSAASDRTSFFGQVGDFADNNRNTLLAVAGVLAGILIVKRVL